MSDKPYAFGVLKSRSDSWKDHILLIDHRYGPFNEFAYGRTLCGLLAAVTDSRGRTLKELTQFVDRQSTCAKCAAKALKLAA